MAGLPLKYPIYIVSKGRWDNGKTYKIFLNANIDFKVVVEPQEADLYAQNIPRENIAVLPFSNLGLGSYPARNWAWEDSIERGFDKHLIFDDNIRSFATLNNGKRVFKTSAKTAIESLIKFTERFERVAMSGFNYSYFVTKQTNKPFFINTHVYSGILINNKIPFRWRLKYNKARSLEQIWPQYVKTVIRFNRPHHMVDWKSHFKHPLIKAKQTA